MSTPSNSIPPSRPRLLVIGSGWVGLYLAQYINPNLYALTIISPRRTSAYTPLLASAACGLFPFSCAEESLRVKGRNYQFYKANATGVDFERKVVRCEAAFDDDVKVAGEEEGEGNGLFELEYEILVIAPGCQTNTFNTLGVAEHALFMKSVSDAMALRKMLFDRLEKATLPCTTPEQAKDLLHVAIVGGGPTGVELTAELSDLSHSELLHLYPSAAPKLHITIYDVAPHILSSFDQKLYSYATETMTKKGINVSTSTVIEKVDSKYLYLKDKGRVGYGILLWVTGNKSLPFVDGLEGVRKSEKGLVRILTDERLRVKRAVPSHTQEEEENTDLVFENVYALGDAADISSLPLPTTADVAVQKARYLVQILNHRLPSSSSNPPAFKYKNKGLVSYIGGHDGIIQGTERNEWTGHQAWLSWRSGSFTWTRTWRNWVGIGWATGMNWVFGKDVARL